MNTVDMPGDDKVGNDKVLTVTYGAFSCTIAGFDAPFDLLALVTDHMHDLATRDPGFGKCPAVVNAPQLGVAAQRQTGDGVELQANSDALILRKLARPKTRNVAPPDPAAGPPKAGASDPDSIQGKVQRLRAALANTSASREGARAGFSEDEHSSPPHRPRVAPPGQVALNNETQDKQAPGNKAPGNKPSGPGTQPANLAVTQSAPDAILGAIPDAMSDPAPDPTHSSAPDSALESSTDSTPNRKEKPPVDVSASQSPPPTTTPTPTMPTIRAALDDAPSVDRLLRATESRLDQDDTSHRRATIAHLKAAAKAGRADTSLTHAPVQEAARKTYRADFAQLAAQQSRASMPAGKATMQTSGPTSGAASGAASKPPPLLLARAQRVLPDVSPAPPAIPQNGPKRHRVSVRDLVINRESVAKTGPEIVTEAGPENTPETTHGAPLETGTGTDCHTLGFEKFVEGRDIHSPAQVLRLAALYHTEALEMPDFTRTMVMRSFAALTPRTGHSRDTGLKAFGKLLRTGVVTRVDKDRFRISDISDLQDTCYARQ